MKTVVITGSSRGFGISQAKIFRRSGWNVVISATNPQRLASALSELQSIDGKSAELLSVVCDVRKEEDVQNLWNCAKETFGTVDIWINNAGVNSPDKPTYQLTEKEIQFLLDIDLKGTILGSKIAFEGMMEQGFGQIFNTEGYGSNDAMRMGLSVYGTAKRAVTYFTRALAKESHELTGDRVKVCRLTLGIMITDFLTSANGETASVSIPDKAKKAYNIWGDYPETIAEYCVPRMIANQKNDADLVWLTGRKAFFRLITFPLTKRDFFAEKM